MPEPVMVVLYDRNRMVWLSRHDDDQLRVAHFFWEAALSAKPVSGSTVETETISALKYSGRAGFVSFADAISAGPVSEAISVILVVSPGDTSLKSRDVITLSPTTGYRIVGVADEEPFSGAKTALEKRMGL